MAGRVRSFTRISISAMFVFFLSAAGLTAQEVVLHSTDITAIIGNWARTTTTGAASGAAMTSTDKAWSSTSQALASPANYFEASFTATAYTPYRIWLRMQAANNSKWNESVWVQFGDSLNSAGSAAYRIGTASSVLVNLEECSACGVSGWGWTGGSYWLSMNQQVQFPSSGTKKIRIQTREDGPQIDQIVLSASKYLTAPPGQAKNDTTILTRSGGATSSTTTTTTTEAGSGAYAGTVAAIPGTIQAENFDLGGSGVAYKDNTTGNTGAKYRSTDVDIETTSDTGGGYDVGWAGAGEWLKYSVNVGSSGTYTLTARVASSGTGGSFHVEFNGTNKTGTMTVPNTGGWQAFRDIAVQVSLSAGAQSMRVVMDSNGGTGAIGNFNYIRLAASSSTTPPPTTSGRIRIMTWNIHFGKNASNVLNLNGQAQLMANSGADVILLQEASTWDGDQPNAFPTLLKQYTGQTWYKVWSPHNLTTRTGEGTLILTRLPIVSSSTNNFYSRGFGRVTVSVSGVSVNIFNAHLDWADTSKRTAELNSLITWAGGYGGPKIVGGDFNSWWGESWITKMMTQYTDTWEDVTGSNQNGYTTGNVRFDYLFRAFVNASRATPTTCTVTSTTLSDHRPVVATYTIR